MQADSENSENSSSISYIPSSSSDSKDLERIKPKQYKIEWFVGPGVKETILGTCQWNVNNVNISNMLLAYRELSIKKASAGTLTLATDILSLNFIFLLEDDVQCMREFFDQQLLASIFQEIRREFVSHMLSDDDILKCYHMSEAARISTKECRDLLKQWNRTVKDDDDNVVLEVFQSIMHSYSSVTNANEDTFVHKTLAPVLSVFFTDNELVECVWANSTLNASFVRKRKFDPSLRGRKPDFGVFVSGQPKAHLLVVEVKPVKYHTADGGWRNDLVKLGNEMKDIIDLIVNDGVEPIEVCGLLVEGFRCDLFVMDLKFDAIYRMIRLGRFYLPQDRHNFDVLPGVINILLQTKSIIIKSAEHCVKCYRQIHTREKTPPQKNNMTRPSFHTPMKVPITDNDQNNSNNADNNN